MKKLTLFLVMATLCLFSKLCAQDTSILTGQVNSSESGHPLRGATVIINGTRFTATTDNNGNFYFPTAPAKGIAYISYTGYTTVQLAFSLSNNNLKVILQNKDNLLQEVQINAGYYSVKDKERTGTIAKVNAETISQQSVSNPLAALQGRVSGLVITQRNGLPGSDFTVQLRGRSSIQSGTSPLYLIDGVPFPTESLAQNSTIAANSPLNTITPSQIESIEVLKDADATAIYGSRGANGVILITTKKGKAGTTSADLNLSTGLGTITRAVEFMDTQQYVEMRKEALANDKVIPTLASDPDLLAWDTGRYTDIKDLLIGGTSKTQNIQFRLSGGNQSTNYSLGANYYKETTVFPGDNALQRKDVNLGLSHSSPDKKFNVNLTGSYGINTSNLYITDLTSQLNLSPNLPPLYDVNGKLNWSENGAVFTNPLGKTLETNYFKTNRFTSNAVFSYRLIPELELKGTAGFNAITLNQYSNTPIAALNPSVNPTGNATFGDNLNETWIVEPQLNYNKQLKKWGKIAVLVGATWQQSTQKSSLVRGTGYTNDLLLRSIEAAVTKTPSNTFSDYKYQAIYSRINYNLMDRYLINLTGRRDGSSRFGPGRQFANFGAIGAAWVLSEESFFRKALPSVSFAKLRGSYGITGNDQISNYQYLDSYISTIAYGGLTGLIPNKLANDNYGWEENRKLEAAMELGFFKDRIRISAGWFRNISANQLISYSLASQTGFPSILRNLDAKIQNQGIELEFTSVNIKGKALNWSTSANFTITRNRLLEFPGLASSSYASTYLIGEPLSIVRGYQYTGINQVTGAYQFEDRNGDGLLNSNDYYNIGTKDPKLYGGLQNSFQYKGISLDVFLQFVSQKGTDMVFGSSNLVGIRVNVPRALTDRWTPANPGAKYQAYSQSSSGAVNQARSMIVNSDAALVDASFIRLKNISLSYELPGRLIQSIKLKKARIYAQGQNLFTITRYLDLDPESQNLTALPPLRMFSFGLQLTL